MIIPAAHTFEPGDAITFDGRSGQARAERFARKAGPAARAIVTGDGTHKVVCDEPFHVIADKELRQLLAQAAREGIIESARKQSNELCRA